SRGYRAINCALCPISTCMHMGLLHCCRRLEILISKCIEAYLNHTLYEFSYQLFSFLCAAHISFRDGFRCTDWGSILVMLKCFSRMPLPNTELNASNGE